MQAKVNWLHVAIKVFHRQLTNARLADPTAEAECKQNCSLIDALVQKSQDLEELLVEVRRGSY